MSTANSDTVVFLSFELLQTCMLYPYVSMLERSGVSLKLLRAQFYFTRFNRVVHQMGRKNPRFLYWWFTVGTVVSIGCTVPAVWVLVKTASGMIRSAATGTQEVQVLEPSASARFSVLFLLHGPKLCDFTARSPALPRYREHTLDIFSLILRAMPSERRTVICSCNKQLHHVQKYSIFVFTFCHIRKYSIVFACVREKSVVLPDCVIRYYR